jgi:hypothetical protein
MLFADISQCTAKILWFFIPFLIQSNNILPQKMDSFQDDNLFPLVLYWYFSLFPLAKNCAVIATLDIAGIKWYKVIRRFVKPKGENK